MSPKHLNFSWAQRCDSCPKCKRALQADEPIWRVRMRRPGRTIFGLPRMKTSIEPICRQCASECVDLREYSSGPCANCGRVVHDAAWRFSRRYRYCCHHCELTDQSARAASAARQRRAEARGPSRACVECGETFEPSRADARFCSARCKQKAYRRRALRLANEKLIAPFESRNGYCVATTGERT